MKRKIEMITVVLCALVLGATCASATPKATPLGFQETVPEVDFRGLGSMGIGTALVAVGYMANKVYRKVVGRKRD